jgi:hypothetical protein
LFVVRIWVAWEVGESHETRQILQVDETERGEKLSNTMWYDAQACPALGGRRLWRQKGQVQSRSGTGDAAGTGAGEIGEEEEIGEA